MQHTFSDINEAYLEMHHSSRHCTDWEETRNGRALAFRGPITVTHTNPERRVLFDPVRDANPFFHYMEAIWMLAGAQDVAFPAYFAKNIQNYSDDEMSLHGAYGYRWRSAFSVDQVETVIEMLRKGRTTRRAVIAMWSPGHDLDVDSNDLPCNTHLYFRYVDGALDMTVCNRSNDMVWGMLGANYVHMGILHEYIANSAALDVGRLHQFSNNLHIYEQHVGKFVHSDSRFYNKPCQRVEFSCDTLDYIEAGHFVNCQLETDHEYKSEILVKNAIPMLETWQAHKAGNIARAYTLVERIFDDDWRQACTEWVDRRWK